jgi:hypothetical protein
MIILVGLLLISPNSQCYTDSGIYSTTKPQLMWNKTWNKTEQSGDIQIALGVNNDIYLAGGTSWSKPSALLLKYDTNGNYIWNRTWKKGNSSQILGLSTDYMNRIYASLGSDIGGELCSYNDTGTLNWSIPVDGYFRSIVTTEEAIYLGGGYNNNATIIKYNYTGNQTWIRNWDGGQYETLNGIAISPDNKTIYGAGILGPKYGAKDLLLIAYSSNGTFLWSKTWGGVSEDGATGIAVDSNGNIYPFGWTDSYGSGNHDFLLLKYDSTGVLKWNRTWGSSDAEDGIGIACRNTDIYVVGMSSGGKTEAVLVKYNDSGFEQWHTSWENATTQGFWGVAVDKDGNIYTAGILSYTGGTVGYYFICKYIEVPNTPEMIAILLPIATVIATFLIVKLRKRRNEQCYVRIV